MKKQKMLNRFKNMTNSIVLYSRESMGISNDKKVFDYFFRSASLLVCPPDMKHKLLTNTLEHPRKWFIRITVYTTYGDDKITELALDEPQIFYDLQEGLEEYRQETINECNAKHILDVEWVAVPYTKEPPSDIDFNNILKRVNNHDRKVAA